MIVGIIGSSSIRDFDISEFIPSETTHIITGTEKEIHKIAQRYAKENEISNTILYPKHEYIEDRPEFLRDMVIGGRCDILFAFWNGKSGTTKDIIDLMQANPSKLTVVLVKKK